MRPSWWAERAELGTIGQPTARMLRFIETVMAPLIRCYYRPKLEGVEHLPVKGPYLLVANHSGCGSTEVLAFVCCYFEAFVGKRPLTGMAHPFAFGVWPISLFMREIGAIPSTRVAAERALTAGLPVLVFPGGDHEALRPIWQANRVDLAGRKGFLRIAKKTGVPIVPVGIVGSHYTVPILWRSRWLLSWLFVWPRLLGVKRSCDTLVGVVGAHALSQLSPALGWPWTITLMWLCLSTPISWLPLVPWTIRMRIGPALANDELFVTGEEEAVLEHAYQRVQGAVQRLVSP